jgi:hypothetical protein
MAKKKHSGAGIVLSHEALTHARRVKHDMSQEQLAIAAQIDVKTVRRAEDEKPIDPAFAHRIAGALGTDLCMLVKQDTTHVHPIADALAKLITTIIFSGNYPPPVRAEAVRRLTALVLLLGFQDGLNEEMLRAIGGSLIVTVPLSRRDAAKLMNAFIAGDLEQFDIVSVNVSTEKASLNPASQSLTIQSEDASTKPMGVSATLTIRGNTLPDTTFTVFNEVVTSDADGRFEVAIDFPFTSGSFALGRNRSRDRLFFATRLARLGNRMKAPTEEDRPPDDPIGELFNPPLLIENEGT